MVQLPFNSLLLHCSLVFVQLFVESAHFGQFCLQPYVLLSELNIDFTVFLHDDAFLVVFYLVSSHETLLVWGQVGGHEDELERYTRALVGGFLKQAHCRVVGSHLPVLKIDSAHSSELPHRAQHHHHIQFECRVIPGDKELCMNIKNGDSIYKPGLEWNQVAVLALSDADLYLGFFLDSDRYTVHLQKQAKHIFNIRLRMTVQHLALGTRLLLSYIQSLVAQRSALFIANCLVDYSFMQFQKPTIILIFILRPNKNTRD